MSVFFWKLCEDKSSDDFNLAAHHYISSKLNFVTLTANAAGGHNLDSFWCKARFPWTKPQKKKYERKRRKEIKTEWNDRWKEEKCQAFTVENNWKLHLYWMCMYLCVCVSLLEYLTFSAYANFAINETISNTRQFICNIFHGKRSIDWTNERPQNHCVYTLLWMAKQREKQWTEIKHTEQRFGVDKDFDIFAVSNPKSIFEYAHSI